MSYRSLAEFLEELAQAGELVRVEAEVDPSLEAAEIVDRLAKAGGPAVLLGVVRGHDVPVVAGLLGSEARICRALGVAALADAALRVEELVRPAEAEGWLERLRSSPQAAALRKAPPRAVRTGPCQQVVRLGSDVDLGRFPLLRCWPEETGPGITAAQVYTADPETGRRVVSHFPWQLLDSRGLAGFWGDHEELARLLQVYRCRGERMPLALVLGGDPVLLLAAAAPLPFPLDRLALAGVLREKPVEVVRCRTSPLEVPAEAEIVIEGHLEPDAPWVATGPLVTATGCYRRGGLRGRIEVTALTHRANPVWWAQVPARPPHEGLVMARALQRVFLPLLRLAVPELVDADLPAFGGARHWLCVSIRKSHAGQARRVAHALWGLETTMLARFLVVLDEQVDVTDPGEVFQAVAEHVDPAHDVFSAQGPPDPLEPLASTDTLPTRLAFDSTRKLPGERAGPVGEAVVMPREIRQRVSSRWIEYAIGLANPESP